MRHPSAHIESTTVRRLTLLLFFCLLHPRNNTARLGTGHFPGPVTPAFFLDGTKAPFATSDEMEFGPGLVPAAHRFLEADGAGHVPRQKFLGGLPAGVAAEF